MLLKPLSSLKHHRAPIKGVDEPSGLFARSSIPVESSCSTSRPHRPSVSLGPWSVEDVQTSLSTSIQQICEAAGLEAAVTSWWRGPWRSAGRSPKAGRKEDVWLRSAVLSGASEKVRQKLTRTGIPEAVIDGGLQLGHFIAEDPEMLQAYASRMKEASERAGETSSFLVGKNQHRNDPRLEFVGHVVSEILRRYDLIYRAPMPSEESTCFQPASLTLAPKPPTRPSKLAGRRKPKPISEPSCPIKQENFTTTCVPDESDAPRTLPATRPTTLSPEPTSQISVTSNSSSCAMTSDLEVTAVTTASSRLAKTLKLSDDIADERSSTRTPHLAASSIQGSVTADERSSTATPPYCGRGASLSSIQGSATPDERRSMATPRLGWRASVPSMASATADERSSTATPRLGSRASVPSMQGSAPLEARKSKSRGSWLAPATPTQSPNSSSTPISARNSKRATTSDLSNPSDLVESPRRAHSSTPQTSKGPQLSQTAPGSFAPGRQGSSLAASPRRRNLQTSSFELWSQRARELSDEKQTVERQTMSKKEKAEMAVHSEGNGSPTQTLLPSKKGFRKVTRDHGELRRIYDSFDKDGSGCIEPEEFLPLLAKLLKQPAESLNRQEVWKNWDEMDADGNGTITFQEFLKWYCTTFDMDINPDRTTFIMEADVDLVQKMIREISVKTNLDILKLEKLHAEFRKLDEDNSGMLEFAEFKVLIQRELSPTGEQEIPAKVIKKFWMDIDADGSGEVSFDEFVVWYMKFFYGTKSPMEQYYEVLGKGNRPN